MSKREIVLKTAFLQQAILKKKNLALGIVPQGCLVTQSMRYDTVSKTNAALFEEYHDYTRYRTLELAVDEIRKNIKSEDIAKACVAEAGVYVGKFAWLINMLFPECRLYLYDTFEGFDKRDMEEEIEKGYSGEKELERLHKLFQTDDLNSQQMMELVKSKMSHPDKVLFRKGYFPDTIGDERDNKFVFVSLDMDLYQPIYEGIMFFYPRLMEGGYIFVHDYNNSEFEGVKVAIEEAEREFGYIHKFPLADQGGTIVLMKHS